MSSILYEFPTNQQTRKFLRLEQSFKTVRGLVEIEEASAQRAALFHLMEIVDFFDRNDVRTDILKELDRLQQSMQVLIDNPAVDSSKLSYFINQLAKLSSNLSNEGRAGDVLKQDPFLTLVRQKWSLGGALCSFDSPQIIRFLGCGPEHTQTRLNQWLDRIKIYRTCCSIILRVYRESGEFTQCITQNLSYQETMDAKIKLVAIKIPQNIPYVPEVSLGAHRLSMQLNPVNPDDVLQDVEIQFSLAHYRA